SGTTTGATTAGCPPTPSHPDAVSCREVKFRGAMIRLVAVVGVCLTPAAAFAAAPGGRPSAKPAVLHQHPHRVSRADPSTRLAPGQALTPRLRAAAPSLPANVLPAGSWASLGPQPIA